jgi:hypothetical protein
VREHPRQPDTGTTLVEMLITMVVLALVVAMSAQVTISIARSMAETRSYADAVGAVRLALGSLERQIRSGDVLFNPVSEASVNPQCIAYGTSAGSCMRVYTQVDGIRRCVQWQVVADSSHSGRALLRTRSFSPSWAVDGDTGTWRTVTTGLQPPSASSPPFTLSGASSAYSTRLLEVSLVAVDASRPSRVTTVNTALSGRDTVYGSDGTFCSPGPS